MFNRPAIAASLLLLVPIACAGPASDEPAAPEETAEEIVRTGDPYERGFTDEDFPRIQELAEGVYSYEQLRGSGDEKFTTVSLIVVSSEGVLVADGQGSVHETQRLVDEIAKITEQPIRWVVVCSDHADHTAGNSAFPEDATFFAHPTSIANLEASANRARQREGAAPVVIPTRSVDGKVELSAGGKEIEMELNGELPAGSGF